MHNECDDHLKQVLDAIRAEGGEIVTGAEADRNLNWAAKAPRVPPNHLHPATIGDTAFVRSEYANNPRVLREEYIHLMQQKLGYGTDRMLEAEISARRLMIANAK